MLLADAGADTIVPVFGILVLFGLPITYAIVSRYLAHQERMEMLRRGIVPPPDPRWAKHAAKTGWYAPGGYPPNAGFQSNAPYTIPYDPYGQARADRYLRKGITLAMIGLALLIGLSFIDNLAGFPGPWLLGGLIPLFAGIAQIIIALLSGARFSPGFQVTDLPPGPAQQQQTGPRQEAPPPPGAPRDIPSGPYAWRPGPTTELEPGSRPPDVRN